MKKLIELWKVICDNCEAVKPTLSDLEKEEYEFARFNIDLDKGQKLMQKYKDKIIENNEVLAFEGRAPSKKEIVEFTGNKFKNE